VTLSVLSVASEAFPLVKTGGLADVVGALPDALSPHGIATTTLLPGYPALAKAVKGATVVHRWPDLLGVEARLLASHIGEHPLLVLDAPELFARPGGLYGQTDDWQRFAAFAFAAAEIAAGVVPGYRFDLLHAHDWERYGSAHGPRDRAPKRATRCGGVYAALSGASPPRAYAPFPLGGR
jgi:starch synthase